MIVEPFERTYCFIDVREIALEIYVDRFVGQIIKVIFPVMLSHLLHDLVGKFSCAD